MDLGPWILANGSCVTSLLGSRVATKSTLDNADTFSVGIMVYYLQRGVPDLLLLPWPFLHRTTQGTAAGFPATPPASQPLAPRQPLFSCCVSSSFFVSATS